MTEMAIFASMGLVVVCCWLLTAPNNKGMTRRSRGGALLGLILALALDKAVTLDGTTRGMAHTALFSLALAGRRFDVGLHEFRPGRVYYRVAVN